MLLCHAYILSYNISYYYALYGVIDMVVLKERGRLLEAEMRTQLRIIIIISSN